MNNYVLTQSKQSSELLTPSSSVCDVPPPLPPLSSLVIFSSLFSSPDTTPELAGFFLNDLLNGFWRVEDIALSDSGFEPVDSN